MLKISREGLDLTRPKSSLLSLTFSQEKQDIKLIRTTLEFQVNSIMAKGEGGTGLLEAGYVTFEGDIIFKSPISTELCPKISLATRYDLNILYNGYSKGEKKGLSHCTLGSRGRVCDT